MQVRTVAYKIVRIIKSLIETKHRFVFTMFSFNEFIFKGFENVKIFFQYFRKFDLKRHEVTKNENDWLQQD